MGTASEQSLRNILTELTAVLTELKLKADLTETQPVSIATMPTTTVQAAGGDKIFAFEGIVEETVSNLSLATGDNSLGGTVCPAGKVQLITQAGLLYEGTAPTHL